MSAHTISSYKFTFVLFISFMEQQKGINVSKIELKNITKESVVEFLGWLQLERKCSNAPRNVRLAALHSFFRYLQYFRSFYCGHDQRPIISPYPDCQNAPSYLKH